MPRVNVLFADQDGEHPFDQALTQQLNIGYAPRWVEPVDLEGDGDLDIVVARMNECADSERPCSLTGYDENGMEEVAGELLVYLNDGQGQFTPWNRDSTDQNDSTPTQIKLPIIGNEYQCVPHSMQSADVDGDGRPELMVFSHQCGAVCIWDPSSYDQEWTCAELSGADQFFPSAVGDLNADGWLDMLVPDRTRGTAFLLQGTSANHFVQDFSFFFVAYYPQGATFVDLDNDGDLDGAVAAVADNGIVVLLENHRDGDGDCYLVPYDCDDTDPYTHPGQIESQVPGLGVGKDNNCNGIIDEQTQWYDDDGDGFSEYIGDCNDEDQLIYPGADEPSCTGLDENCDGFSGLEEESLNGVDDDCDVDHIVDNGTVAWDDDQDGYSELEGDCNDADNAVYPGAEEPRPADARGDDKDNDCDGLIDEGTTSSDDDGDGQTEQEGDCNDVDASIFDGAPELLDDQKDNNCNGEVNELTGSGGCQTSPGSTSSHGGTLLLLIGFLVLRPSRPMKQLTMTGGSVRAIRYGVMHRFPYQSERLSSKLAPCLLPWSFGLLASGVCFAGPRSYADSEPVLAPRSTYIAIVIGINTYEDPAWEPLHHAESDAESMAQALSDPALGGFDQVLRLSGRGATRLRIKETLVSLRTLPQDVVVVYFAGHAIRARDRYGYWHQYLIPWDGSQRFLDETSIRFEWLAEEVEHFRAQGRVIIIDACNNIYEPDRPFLKGLRGSSDDWVNLRYSIYMRSAGEGMRAREEDRLRHGVYTYFLLEALQQREGNADKDNDGAISAYEAHAMAALKTRRFTEEAQVPMVSEIEAGAPEVVLSGRRSQRMPTRAVIADSIAMGRSRGSVLRAQSIRGGSPQEAPLEEGLVLEPGQYEVALVSADGALLRRARTRVYAGLNRLQQLFMPPTLQPILLSVTPSLRLSRALSGVSLLPVLAYGTELSISGGIYERWGLLLGMGYVSGPIPPYPDGSHTWIHSALVHHSGSNRIALVVGPRLEVGLALQGSRAGTSGPTFVLSAGTHTGVWFRLFPGLFLGTSVDVSLAVLREHSGTSAPHLQTTPQLNLAYGF